MQYKENEVSLEHVVSQRARREASAKFSSESYFYVGNNPYSAFFGIVLLSATTYYYDSIAVLAC